MGVEQGVILEVVAMVIAVESLVFAILATWYARESTKLSQEQLKLAESVEERTSQWHELEIEAADSPVKDVTLTRSKTASGPNCYALLVVMDASLRNQSSRNNAVSKPKLQYVKEFQVYSKEPAKRTDKDNYEMPFPSNSDLEFDIGAGSRKPISASFYLGPLSTPQQWYEDPHKDTVFTMVENYDRMVRIPLHKVAKLAETAASRELPPASNQERR